MRKLLLFLSAVCVLASCETLEDVITGESPEEILGIQQWRCISGLDWAMYKVEGGFSDKKVIVRLSRPAGKEGGFGEVTVAGITHPAFFAVEGVNLRWQFGDDSQYAFIIRPDGSAGYYDFSGVDEEEKIGANQTYGCKTRG